MSAADFYAYSSGLLPCVMSMSARGVKVDERLRQERITALSSEAARLHAEAEPLVVALRDKLKRPDLLWKRKVCKACRNGKKKRLSCAACHGAGSAESLLLKLGSSKQLGDVLYNGLRLPRRSRDGHETTDEEALQSLLALDKSGLVKLALRHAKLDTIREIYERISPGTDGRVRTVFNIAGTYTGRFSSSEAFYVPHSTNLQNLPAEQARRDVLFAVRECLIPRDGEVFVYADLAQAEARVVACLAEEDEILARWQANPHWSIHKWLASLNLNCAEADVKKDSPEYFLFKQSVHALSYGEGATKFWREVNSRADLTGYAITLAQAKAQRSAYMALRPNIDGVWWARVQRTLETREPMRASHCGWECPFWPRFLPDGSLDPASLRAAIAWEPQHTVVHVLNEGMKELYDNERGNGYRVLLQGHDSVLLGVDKHRVHGVAQRAKRALERPMTVHGRRLTIPCEVFVSKKNFGEAERLL